MAKTAEEWAAEWVANIHNQTGEFPAQWEVDEYRKVIAAAMAAARAEALDSVRAIMSAHKHHLATLLVSGGVGAPLVSELTTWLAEQGRLAARDRSGKETP